MRIFGALMSTKNLARTAIEGGRCGYYQSEVRTQKRAERAALRTYLRDPDESRAEPRRKPVRVCFSDKLAPVRRYLDSQAGRPWNKVRSELFQRFDIRTTPGRHVLFDHVLKDVEELPRRWRPSEPRIDAHGILQRDDRKRYRRAKPETFDRRAVARLLDGRKVRPNGDRLVWLAPIERHVKVHARYDRYDLSYVVHDDKGEPLLQFNEYRKRWEYRPLTWLPRGLLSRADEAFLRALPEHALTSILTGS